MRSTDRLPVPGNTMVPAFLPPSSQFARVHWRTKLPQSWITFKPWKATPFSPNGISYHKNPRAEVLEAAVGKDATKKWAEQGRQRSLGLGKPLSLVYNTWIHDVVLKWSPNLAPTKYITETWWLSFTYSSRKKWASGRPGRSCRHMASIQRLSQSTNLLLQCYNHSSVLHSGRGREATKSPINRQVASALEKE